MTNKKIIKLSDPIPKTRKTTQKICKYNMGEMDRASNMSGNTNNGLKEPM